LGIFNKRRKGVFQIRAKYLRKEVRIYGFGSYFSECPKYNDVDILIVHQSSSLKSCQFAIHCKQFFVSNIAKVDVTILSRHEEQQISFIEISNAQYIGKVDENFIAINLNEILGKIRQHDKVCLL
jgi:hypothetical protein